MDDCDANFGLRVEKWYELNKRDLPWRNTQDPYRVWISEIILQQTRVAQGYDYYLRFLEHFPTVERLAAANADEVMRCWQGLGYYSRARHLHQAAQQIVQRGAFPNTYEEILKLQGVGEYTAAAIGSFSFQLPHAVIDGNVYRVLARIFEIDTPIDSTEGKKQFRELAYALLDRRSPALYNQAMMELGAIQCVPVRPLCSTCPMNDICQALAKGRVDELPVKAHKTKVTDRYFHYLWIHSANALLLHQRTGQDIWQNLYEMPLIETAEALDEEAFYALPAWLQWAGQLTTDATFAVHVILPPVRHVLSHQVLHADFYEITVSELSPFTGYLPVLYSNLDRYALPRLLQQFLQIHKILVE